MNSVIEAQEEYFDGKILLTAPCMPASMLTIPIFKTKDYQQQQQRDKERIPYPVSELCCPAANESLG
jgi:hypothetical protein